MSLYRYLLYISYIGKQFRGAQRQVKGGTPRPDDPSTVQGRLEMALQQLNPCNEPVVYLSSRTDSGVHALSSTCHVDLYRKNGMWYEPKTVTIILNKYFAKQDLDIRVIRTCIVPDNFHSRHNAISRTYLYRLILAKAEALNVSPHYHYFPIEESRRSLYYCTNYFDTNLMREGAKLIEGYHDFRTFMASHVNCEEKLTRKTVEKIEIFENKQIYGYSNFSWPSCIQNDVNEYRFLDIYITSDGFLYKQVRRTVATLVAVAQGKVTLKDIKFMLEVPSPKSWCNNIKTVPAFGLYLCEVKYCKEDLGKFKSDLGNN